MPTTPHILVISRTEDDQAYLEDFFERTPLPKPDFVIGKFVPSDKYDFLVFNSRYYYNLNVERCQAANSKFSLYARLREMIDFIGNFRQ
jgi:hypothetical protein